MPCKITLLQCQHQLRWVVVGEPWQTPGQSALLIEMLYSFVRAALVLLAIHQNILGALLFYGNAKIQPFSGLLIY